MTARAKNKILMVDDEPNVLAAFRRSIGRQYDLSVAEGGPAGLSALQSEAQFAVVVSDMRMPGMNGVEFIRAARKLAPDTVYMMLTGNADQDTAIQAINEGRIFRFLNKPCPAEVLTEAIDAAIRQHNLITAEKVLLRRTLLGCVTVMSDALSLSNPKAALRNQRIQEIVRGLCKELTLPTAWQLNIAASLCHIGLVTMPQLSESDDLDERALAECSEVGARLIGHIPRLENVAEIIKRQREDCKSGGELELSDESNSVDLGARVLRLAVDFESLLSERRSQAAAISTLAARTGVYDSRLLAAAAKLKLSVDVGNERKLIRAEVSPMDLREGMTLDEALSLKDRSLLLASGQTLTRSAVERIRNFARMGQLPDRVAVVYEDESLGTAAAVRKSGIPG